MEISVVGINHRSAPVDVRELFALPGESASALLRAIRSECLFDEALVLNTCNRTEVYLVSDEPQACESMLFALLARIKSADAAAHASHFYRHDGLAAVKHLFRVAASLDSQIVGEDQILGQVKEAYRAAVAEQSSSYVLNRLLHRAMRVGKRVRTQTELSRGAASIPQAAVELAHQVFSNLTGKTAMLVGAGKTAQLAACNLIGCGVGRIIVANRTLSNAQAVAAELLQTHGCEQPLAQDAAEPACPMPPTRAALTTHAISLADIPSAISDAHLVICSTGSPDAVLTLESLGPALSRRHHPLLIVDIAVPRDADPRLNGINNVFLYNIDDLNRLVSANIERRRQEIPRADAIVDYEVQTFSRWFDSLEAAPTVKLLQQHFEELRKAEIKRYGHQFSDADSAQLERFAESLCKKILHKPLVFLRAGSGTTPVESKAAADLVRRMFGLDSLDEIKGEDAADDSDNGLEKQQ